MKRPSIARRFIRDETGATALEFGLVGPPFLLLILSVLEFGLVLLTQSVLDGATRVAARDIRTNQVQAAGSTSQQITAFQTALCAQIGMLLTGATCDSNVVFAVQTFGTFGAVSFPACNHVQGQSGSGTTCPFNAGNPKDIVGVKVSYSRPFIIPWVGACLSGGNCWTGKGPASTSGGTQSVTLTSTVVFRNEP